jgi:hypothetical protein
MDGLEQPTVEQIEEEFLALLDSGGLAQPDEVRRDPEAGEVTFLWYEPRLAVVVGPESPGGKHACLPERACRM